MNISHQVRKIKITTTLCQLTPDFIAKLMKTTVFRAFWILELQVRNNRSLALTTYVIRIK